MTYGWIFLGIRYWEFLGMRMQKDSFREIKNFVPRWEEEDLYFQVNNIRYVKILEDKYSCYELFKNYYLRKVVGSEQKNELNDFIKNTDGFIVKPLGGMCGTGIEIVRHADEKCVTDLYEKHEGPFLVEELIKQDKRIAELHSESVNTIRVFTINYGGEIEVEWPCLRVGRGKTAVDNMGKGGIGIAINKVTGVAINAGDEKGNVYYSHPESNVDLVGFQVPEWNALCKIVKEMAEKCPDCRIMGWDMALSEQGWCVVECNFGPGIIYQYANRSGERKRFEDVKKRLGSTKGKSLRKHLPSPYLRKP